MPHAVSMPAPGFQAIILCGPGSSFPTFTANADENPKALLPIANRPMVWYPIDFCYRMGITNITLIAPPSSAPAIRTAMNTNPHLTGLPVPKPNILAPEGLDQNTGTAQIFRLPEVRALITSDFVVLPCDLVCELGGEALLETWMIKEAGLGGATGGGEKGGRSGGLGVWYETKGGPKGEETDFIATSPLQQGAVPPSKTSLLPHLSNLVYSVPTDTLNDITEDKKSLPIRHSLINSHPRVRMLSTHRDAHIYVFPAWVIDMINANEHMDSVGEDVIGWWAKAGWQEGLGDKLGLREILQPSKPIDSDDNMLDNSHESAAVDFGALSTTWTSQLATSLPETGSTESEKPKLTIPPILAYVHPSTIVAPKSAIIRRVDTAPLLLEISLQLAKLDSIKDVEFKKLPRESASPFAHPEKVAYPDGLPRKLCTLTRQDCLLAENVTVEEKTLIKECVIGANCQIKTGAKLTRCLLMDGVVVGKNCRLTNCVLGRRSEIGEDSVLQDCEVQENLMVEAGTEEKKNKLMSSEGMEATEEDLQEAFDDEDLMEPSESQDLEIDPLSS